MVKNIDTIRQQCRRMRDLRFLLFVCLSQWCGTFGGSRRYFSCCRWLRSPCWTVFWPLLPNRSPCARLCAATATWSSPTHAWIVKSQRVSAFTSQCTILSAVTFIFMVFMWVHLSLCHSYLRRLDSWLVAAVDCLELFPDQLIVAASEQLIQQNATSGEGKHKRLLFDTIAKYYNSPERPPLLPGRYTDIQTGILHLLGNL